MCEYKIQRSDGLYQKLRRLKKYKELKLTCAQKHFAFPSDRAKGASKPQA